MKRFWDQADVVAEGDVWAVTLDGKPVRVPGGGPLTLPTQPLAHAVAAEWQAAGGEKGGEMSYADLPLTRLAGTAQERIAPNPGPVVLELAHYAEADLLCYRADQPQSLVQRQQEQWQPWLDWIAQRHGVHLQVTSGIVHVQQSEQAITGLTLAVARLNPYQLAAIGILVPSFGSLVLGLAVAECALSANEAHEIATLDERHQAEFWGSDHEAETRMINVAEDIAAAGRFLDLCAP
jgi:chaperone required for assembly of F1-ATPase